MRFGYLLVEERAYGAERMRGRRNAAVVVFRLENCRTPEEIRQVIEDILRWFPGEEHQSLRCSLATWMLQVLLPNRFPGIAFPMIGNLMEAKSMLAENIAEWSRNLEEKGMENGSRRGDRGRYPAW